MGERKGGGKVVGGELEWGVGRREREKKTERERDRECIFVERKENQYFINSSTIPPMIFSWFDSINIQVVWFLCLPDHCSVCCSAESAVVVTLWLPGNDCYMQFCYMQFRR